MRKVIFLEKSLHELKQYKNTEPKLVFKILELIQDINKTPFEGLGKPEPLKGKMQGYWSRRNWPLIKCRLFAMTLNIQVNTSRLLRWWNLNIFEI